MGWEDLSKLAHHQIMSQPKTVILVHTVQLKPIIKAQISTGISDIAIASVHSEKTGLKKLIINKSQEATVLAVARN